jgi:hypothetical protein
MLATISHQPPILTQCRLKTLDSTLSHSPTNPPRVQSSLMLRPTVSRTVCLGINHTSGAYDQIFITVRQLRICWCGALWREDGPVVYNCCWPSLVQSFSGSSPVGFVTIVYCLRFQTSIIVASYDSQGYGGGIRPRLHMGSQCDNQPTLLHRPPYVVSELTA